MKNQKIWVCVTKSGIPLMFIGDEPQRTKDSWNGTHYVNSMLYEQVCVMVKQVDMSFNNDAELIEFQIKED